MTQHHVFIKTFSRNDTPQHILKVDTECGNIVKHHLLSSGSLRIAGHHPWLSGQGEVTVQDHIEQVKDDTQCSMIGGCQKDDLQHRLTYDYQRPSQTWNILGFTRREDFRQKMEIHCLSHMVLHIKLCPPQNSYVEFLTPSILEVDSVGRFETLKKKWINMSSLEWALTQYSWYPFKKKR